MRDRINVIRHPSVSAVLLICGYPVALGHAVGVQPPATPATSRATIAVVNVAVIPMDCERVVSNQTVLVQGDRIVAVGSASDVPLPDGAVVIDGGGRYLLPGLTDAHVHLSTTLPWAPARSDFGDGPLYLANGVTTVINLGGSTEQIDWRRRVHSGELPGPSIYTSGEFINEPRMAKPEQVAEAVLAQQQEGYDLIKFRERPNTTAGLSLAAYREMIKVAREARLPLVGHAPVNLGLDALLEAGQPLAHINMLSNLYFMPVASHPQTVLVSGCAVVALLVFALIVGSMSWRNRRRSQLVANSSSASSVAGLVAALALGGLVAAGSLVSVLPGGPASESLALRWFVTAVTAIFSLGVILLLVCMARVWTSASLQIRFLGTLTAGAGLVLAWSLVIFWVPVAWRSSDVGIADVAGRLRDAGVSVQSTLVVYDSLGGAARAEMMADPAIAYAHPRTRELWAGLPRTGPPGYQLPAFTKRLTSALHRAGVPIVLGTDAMGMELILPGFSLHRELQLLRGAGLTPYEAIYAATRAPAEFLQQSSEFGMIAAGQRADFLLVAQNPLEDISRLARPLGVMARGRWFPRERLQEMLGILRLQG